MDVSLCFKLVIIFNLTKKVTRIISIFFNSNNGNRRINIFGPQYLYEQSIGLDVKINKAFILILIYVVIFPANCSVLLLAESY